MRKIFVAIALIAGLGTSSVAFANAKTTNEISITRVRDKFCSKERELV